MIVRWSLAVYYAVSPITKARSDECARQMRDAAAAQHIDALDCARHSSWHVLRCLKGLFGTMDLTAQVTWCIDTISSPLTSK